VEAVTDKLPGIHGEGLGTGLPHGGDYADVELRALAFLAEQAENLGPAAGAKPDEHELWAALLAGETPRAAGQRLGIPHRRVVYICEKWSRQRIYNYGVTADLGWPER
jgi:hypothetical protein